MGNSAVNGAFGVKSGLLTNLSEWMVMMSNDCVADSKAVFGVSGISGKGNEFGFAQNCSIIWFMKYAPDIEHVLYKPVFFL